MVGWPETSGAEAPPAPSVRPPEPDPTGYRPLRAYATVTRIALGFVAFASIVAAVFDASARDLLSGRASTGELLASDDRQVVLGLLFVLALLVTVIFFITWLYRAYANLRALGVESLRFGTGWAIGAWFIPILNLFRPVQIVNDVWRGSHPYLDDRRGWRDARVPQLIGLWWGAWLVSGVVGGIAGLMLEDATGGSEVVDSSYGVAIASDVLTAVAALLALAVVDRTTARQEAAAARAFGSAGPAVPVRPWLLGWRRLAVAGGLCAAAAALGALVVAVQPARTPTFEAAPQTSPAGPTPSTFTHTDDFSDPTSGWIVREDASASYAYADAGYEVSALKPEEIWFSFLFLGFTMDRMVVEVDATLRSPPADDDGVGVGCFATEHAGYMANVWPDGYYVIAFDPPETEEFTSLQEGTSEAIEGRGGTNRIALECVRGPPTVVTLTVNGTRVSEARHPDGVMTFGAVALLVTSGGDAATGHFDNLAISGS